MSLHITTADIYDLAEHATHNTSRPAEEIGITLGPNGWSVAAAPTGWPHPNLVAVTAADIHAWCDGEPLDDTIADALTTPAPPDGDTYAIPDEGGATTSPSTGASWQVITGSLLSAPTGGQFEAALDWRGAYWIDSDTLTELVPRSAHDYGRDGTGRTESLWLTPGGRYVALLESRHIGEFVSVSDAEVWVEVPLDVATIMTYQSADRVADPALLPPPLAAAWHAAQLTAQLTAQLAATNVSPEPGPAAQQRHRRVLREQTETVHATRVLSELLRGTVLAELRRHRAQAARSVVAAHDGSQATAAAHLRMHVSTLSNLIS